MRNSRNTFLLGILLAIVTAGTFLLVGPVLAQAVDPTNSLANFAADAGFSTQGSVIVIIARLIRTFLGFLGIVSVILVIYGGWMFMTAAGNPQKVEKAKKIIINAGIGLIITLSAFLIVNFIVGIMTGALGGGLEGDDSLCPDGTPRPCVCVGAGCNDFKSGFYLEGPPVNEECDGELRNLQLQFVFSASVKEETVENGILVRRALTEQQNPGQAVPGVFVVDGDKVTFTPSAECPAPNAAHKCFDENTKFVVNLDRTVLKSATDKKLKCTNFTPCEYSFTTGDGVDVLPPTVVMDAPDDGSNSAIGDIVKLQADTTDDTGLSSVDFFVEDDRIDSVGIEQSFEDAGHVFFFTDDLEEWDTAGYPTNRNYEISARGSDCAGNTTTSAAITTSILAAQCFNGVQDAEDPFLETGIDCGGDPASEYYCKECNGNQCDENGDCASGLCQNNVCVEVAKIEEVSPGDGAIGNLVTISGKGFGDAIGVVRFLGSDDEGDEVQADPFVCIGGEAPKWSPTEIIVQIPNSAVDGPVRVETAGANATIDSTDDNFGPRIADFDVNLIVRPGLCDLDPSLGQPTSAATATGIGFGNTKGSSKLFLSNGETDTSGWANTEIDFVVPSLSALKHQARVFTGDYVCIDGQGNLTGEDDAGNPVGIVCNNNDDCEGGETCATAWCSESLAYCSDDNDCVDAGSCQSVRVGSNKMRFTVLARDVDLDPPNISEVSTGWKACENSGLVCGDDDDCADGESCVSRPNWGPVGQYVTILGTRFGFTPGTVRFLHDTEDKIALGDSDFPDQCGGNQWTNNSIIVKVPAEYQTDPVEAIAEVLHQLFVIRHPGHPVNDKSNLVDFSVIEGSPGPSICATNPTAGPAGLKVKLIGENFGNPGKVTFYNGVHAVGGEEIWTSELISKVEIPEAAITGPMSMNNNTGKSSNAVNFKVGDCQTGELVCEQNEECCNNGSCALVGECELPPPESHFAYIITTGIIPQKPVVLEACDANVISPSPWESWSDPEDVCVNAEITATFSMSMNQSTFVPDNIVLEKCIDYDEGICSAWQNQTITITPNQTGFSALRAENQTLLNLEVNTDYKVTIRATKEAGGIAAHPNEGGGYLEEEYVFQFKTKNNEQFCEVGNVNVTPARFTAVEQDETVNYKAQLIAQNDSCVTLACNKKPDGGNYQLAWTSKLNDANFAGAELANANPDAGVCTNIVTARSETPPQIPAKINATVSNADNNPDDNADLTILFTDPKVTFFSPDCMAACVNALPLAQFNTRIDPQSVGVASVQLFECQDTICAPQEFGQPIAVNSAYDPGNKRITINLPINNQGNTIKLNPDKWHRVIIKGGVTLAQKANGIQSESGVSLGDSGSNFGQDHNMFNPGDFSWIFKTKNSNVSCAIDKIKVLPFVANMTYVGQRQDFHAYPFGAPDECSINGQALQAGDFDWLPWSSLDNPDNFEVANGGTVSDVALMLKSPDAEPSGVIKFAENPPPYCTAACTNAGTQHKTTDPICGDNIILSIDDVVVAEECDDGNIVAGDGCSPKCLTEPIARCAKTCSISGDACNEDVLCGEGAGVCEIPQGAVNCCGNGASEAGEECDDGNEINGDGCSNSCLNNGSSAVNAFCGDGQIDHAPNAGGEDCDDGNVIDGDGCSSECLFEGAIAQVGVSICGNGGEPELGEDCEDGNIVDGDGCSSSCQNEGTPVCVKQCENSENACNGPADCDDGEACEFVNPKCCGNNIVEAELNAREDCDDGNTEDGDGCSSACLNEGSSIHYPTASYCMDGVVGTGEECEAAANSPSETGAFGVAEVRANAVFEVDEESGYAISEIFAAESAVIGKASLQLQCSCSTDLSCNADGAATNGCGQSNCCFIRPTKGVNKPDDNTNGGVGHCRNTAVWVEFDQKMDPTTLNPKNKNPNLYLDLVEYKVCVEDNTNEQSNACNNNADCQQGSSCQTIEVQAEDDCPNNYLKLALNTQDQNVFARAWGWFKGFMLSFFGQPVIASEAFGCYMPINYEVVNGENNQRVYLRYNELLKANAEYRVVLKADNTPNNLTKDGVLSEFGVTLCSGGNCANAQVVMPFAVGEEICTLDKVEVKDLGKLGTAQFESKSVEFFTATNERHEFISIPLTFRQVLAAYEEITPLNNIYSWEWAWGSETADDNVADVVKIEVDEVSVQGDGVGNNPANEDSEYSAVGNDGQENVIATAGISADTVNLPSTQGDDTDGQLQVLALLCENSWPAIAPNVDFPYKDDISNFSFYYCRDEGEDGTDDDLPALETEIDVTSLAGQNIIQELIFKVSGTNDAIGVRVLQNPEYLTPAKWFKEQGFTGSATPTELDGYEAVRAGNTIYAAATNIGEVGGITKIFPNIYVISYNNDAKNASKQVFEKILKNFRFNSNTDEITDVNLCKAGGNYLKDKDENFISCRWNGDCVELCTNGTCDISGKSCENNNECTLKENVNAFCDSDKDKLRRDMKRLTDITEFVEIVHDYGSSNGHCAVTKNQACTQDVHCPGEETCVPNVPSLASGSFVPSYSLSTWGSWNSVLGNELGSSIPVDPINEFWLSCRDYGPGYDQASCWNGAEGQFRCDRKSRIYSYRVIRDDFYFYTTLEYEDHPWSNRIDMPNNDNANIRAAYESSRNSPRNRPTGFRTSNYVCDGGLVGSSEICGDSVLGQGEVCEIGDSSTTDCKVCVDGEGIALGTCNVDVGADCDVDGEAGKCRNGLIPIACNANCNGFQSAADALGAGAACVPYRCGNGVIEPDAGEVCDDGGLNGTYGHCDDNCSLTNAITCGDGYLSGSEQCDCGTVQNYNNLPNNSWARLGNNCSYNAGGQLIRLPNGIYNPNSANSCSFDCKNPGPTCGDGFVNGGEDCDGGFEKYAGAMCQDGTPCAVDADCSAGACDLNAACGTGRVCGEYEDAGDECENNNDCDSNSCVNNECDCGEYTYELYRTRKCDACTWPVWSICIGGPQYCGNGIKEGTEVCDDGNKSNNDSCLNSCKKNICGDDHLYVGVESCDAGASNFDPTSNEDPCAPPYNGTCNYCNALCQYKTYSGAYCGDGVRNGNEFCDGSDVPTVGTCNGGTDNGLECEDNGDCAGGGDCVLPKCFSNCAGACPKNFISDQIKIKSEEPGALPVNSLNLFSFLNKEHNSPDTATLQIPACTVGTWLKADVKKGSDYELPKVDIVFVTDLSGSMGHDISGQERIEVVVESTKKAISDLFDVYEANSAENNIRIALVSYTSRYTYADSDDAGWCNVDKKKNITINGSWAEKISGDRSFAGVNQENDLIARVNTYLDCASWGTPTYNGLKQAMKVFSDEANNDPNALKFVILLSDGDPTHTYVDNHGGNVECPATNFNGHNYPAQIDHDNNPATDLVRNTPACVAYIDKLIVKEPSNNDVSFYSAAITTNNSLKGYMAHMSSNQCAFEDPPNGIARVNDCDADGFYAYVASTADQVTSMYENIVSSIIGNNVTTTVAGQSTQGAVKIGSDVALPFPDGFSCPTDAENVGKPFEIPLRTTFNATGPLNFSNVEFTYCPY